MRTLIEILADLAILANAGIYGTDVFGAIVQRPAAATGHWLSTGAGALATLVLLTFIGIYTRIRKPVNRTLTAAAVAGQVPADARQLQSRWDSVINGRVALQATALAALCVALAAA